MVALTGVGLVVASVTAAEPDLRPPAPAPAAAPPTAPPPVTPTAAATAGDPTAAPVTPVAMPRSAPTRIRIPRIGVDAGILSLGVTDEGRVEVPALEQADLAGWYRLGPSPGEIGNSVIVGHVDSYAMGPAVFFDLGRLRPGDSIEVDRTDGTVARFVVDGVASYPKREFPTDLVYGASAYPGLRVITCGGAFDEQVREYRDNVIVFARLVTDAPAR